MTDKTREDFEAWAQSTPVNLKRSDIGNSYESSVAAFAFRAYQAATQQSAARIAALEAENDAIAELNHAQWLALENVRHLAARNRKEEWAQHLLRFVEQAGTNKAQIMRKQVDATALEAEVQALRKDAERYAWLREQNANLDAGFYVGDEKDKLPEDITWVGSDLDEAIDAAIDAERGKR